MISSAEAYTKLLPTFSAIRPEDLYKPTMPRQDIVGETTELKVNGLMDRDTLVANGLDPLWIDSLEVRIGAYAHASSEYETSEFTKSEARQKWESIQEGVYAFRKDYLDILRFAFRKSKELLALVDNIAEGRGHRDHVLDLKDCHLLTEKNRPALEKINFDFDKSQKAIEMFEEANNLLAEANTTPEEISAKRLTAFQAYTYLKQAVDEIREFGQFCYRNDPERLKVYKSDYYQGLRKSGQKPAQAGGSESSSN
jgi:hypothetical protein